MTKLLLALALTYVPVAQAATFTCIDEIGQTINSDGADYTLEVENYGQPGAKLTFAKVSYTQASPADFREFRSESVTAFTLRLSEQVINGKAGVIAQNEFDGLKREYLGSTLFQCAPDAPAKNEEQL